MWGHGLCEVAGDLRVATVLAAPGTGARSVEVAPGTGATSVKGGGAPPSRGLGA
jgi:hypothetical protein